MGAKQSTEFRTKKSKRKMKKTSSMEEYEDDLDLDPVGGLSIKEKELIKKTWNKIELDAERVGARTFSNLFDMHPSARDEFTPFKSIDVKDEKYNEILQEHGVRVLSVFGRMVKKIDDDLEIIPMLTELGTRHGARYNAKSSLVSIVGPHFLKAIQTCLGKEFTPELEAAYRHMFEILTYHMKTALQQASMNFKLIY